MRQRAYVVGPAVVSPRAAILPASSPNTYVSGARSLPRTGCRPGPRTSSSAAAPRRGRKYPGGHMTQSQDKRCGGKYPRPACTEAQADTARAYLADGTPYAGRRGHISSRLAAGESVPAVSESCGTSRKTIIAHYHEDVGDDFERPYPPFEQQSARARGEVAPIWVPRAPATETLRCHAGHHEWERQKRPGTKPRSCTDHRSTRAHADVVERARAGAPAAPARGFDAVRRSSSRAARASRRYPSRRSNFAGVCRFCVDNTGVALAVRPQRRRTACKMPS